MRALLLAEKPSLMRDIESVYRGMSFPDDITFMALRGHLLELKEPEEYNSDWGKPWRMEVLPMIPDKFEHKVINTNFGGRKNDCRPLVKQIKEELNSGKYDYVINACDAGREGELIFYELYKTLGCKLPVKRFWSSNTTDDGIKKALNNLIDDKDKSLVCLKASAQYRAYFDWLLGMNLTRAFSLRTKSLNPLGRVMTPTLAMIVNRELEIRNFVPQDYWEIEGDFGKYKGIWFDAETKESKITDKTKADKITKGLSNKGTIAEVKKEQEKRYAPTLHSLLELQREANRAYGYTSGKTLEIAQVLYEEKKILSYPRTESRYLPTDMVKEIPKHIQGLANIPEVKTVVEGILADTKKINSVLSSKRYVDDKKLTDHHAIIPTNKKPDMGTLTKEQANIYMLVVKRFLAIFLDPYVADKTTIVTKVDDELFKTTGKTVIDKGYTILYNENSKEDVIPAVKEGEEVPVVGIKILTKQTTPPQRYTDDSLLLAMQNAGRFIDDEEMKSVLKETAGLGTSATRADIIKKLIDRQMTELKGKQYHATEKGIQVITALRGKDIISPELTARWEMKLRDIEEQKYDAKVFYQEMLDYTREVTKDFMNNISATINGNTDNVIGKCPICAGSVVEGKSFYFCSNYKNTCNLIIGKTVGQVKLPKTEIKKLLDGKETKEMEFTWKSGKKGKAKLKIDEKGVVAPLFSNSNSKEKEAVAKNSDNADGDSKEKDFEVIGKCPKCGDDVINAKDFYLCKHYQDGCDFNLKKTIKGGYISPENAKSILEGEETNDITFVWNSGKSGKARLKWENGELRWVFPSR